MKTTTIRKTFLLSVAVALAYTLFFVFGIALAGLSVMEPWAPLGGLLLAICFACFTWLKSRECAECLDEVARFALPNR